MTLQFGLLHGFLQWQEVILQVSRKHKNVGYERKEGSYTWFVSLPENEIPMRLWQTYFLHVSINALVLPCNILLAASPSPVKMQPN